MDADFICYYSQGGQLVHNAAAMLSPEDTAFVNSGTLPFHSLARSPYLPIDQLKLTYQTPPALIFGDPDDGQAVGNVPAAQTKVICHDGDLICAHQAVVLAPHLTYSMDAATAATFVVGAAKGAGKM